MSARRAATGAVVLVVLALAVVGLVRAASPTGTPTVRERADAVAATLRCPTCQGLSIEDSTSVLAAGSRRIIEQQLEQGRTPDQVRQWFVDRYGPTVLLSPDPAGPGLLAWVVPGLALLAGGALVWRWLRRGPASAGTAPDEVAAVLAAWREGALDPDDSPAGEALRAALVAADAEEDTGEDAGEDAGTRAAVATAHRRYAVRPASAAAPPARSRRLPRRAVTLGAAGAVLVAAGVAVAVDGGAGGEPTAAAGTSAPAASDAAVPSPPAGWTGGMPRTPEDWVALGRAYDRDGNPDQAVAAYDMALRLQPDADAVLLLRADVLVRSGHPDQALPDLRALDARHPDTPDVLLVLGLALDRTGSPDATATLQRFLELDPDSPAAPGVRGLLDAG